MRTIKTLAGEEKDVTANQWIILSWLATMKKENASEELLTGIEISAESVKAPMELCRDIRNGILHPYRNMKIKDKHVMLTDN
jgi:hypothetical protein